MKGHRTKLDLIAIIRRIIGVVHQIVIIVIILRVGKRKWRWIVGDRMG